MSTLVEMSRSHILRSILNRSGVSRAINRFILSRWPIQRSLPGGTRYQCASTTDLATAIELFAHGVYPMSLVTPSSDMQVVDVGCNVGYFSLLVADHFRHLQPSFTLIDANLRVLNQACWHLNLNGLTAKPIHAIAGSQSNTFWVNNLNSTTSASFILESNPSWHNRLLTPVKVKPVAVSGLIGGEVGLMKIDIEGDELSFLSKESDLLCRTAQLFIEWHTYACSFAQINSLLNDYGMSHCRILEQSDAGGVAFFRR